MEIKVIFTKTKSEAENSMALYGGPIAVQALI